MQTLILLAETATTASNGGKDPGMGSMFTTMAIYIVIFVGFIYFFMIRPQKKQQTKMSMVLSSVEPGDNILTTSGFYGIVLDVNDDTVIVEFGNNKNCRIPMQKSAIVEVEKPNQGE